MEVCNSSGVQVL